MQLYFHVSISLPPANVVYWKVMFSVLSVRCDHYHWSVTGYMGVTIYHMDLSEPVHLGPPTTWKPSTAWTWANLFTYSPGTPFSLTSTPTPYIYWQVGSWPSTESLSCCLGAESPGAKHLLLNIEMDSNREPIKLSNF